MYRQLWLCASHTISVTDAHSSRASVRSSMYTSLWQTRFPKKKVIGYLNVVITAGDYKDKQTFKTNVAGLKQNNFFLT